jgi:hypothetical protein
MSSARSVSRWRRPRVSTFAVIRDVAARFVPPLEMQKEEPWAGRLILRDPSGKRPRIVLSHRYKRRLFLRANYLNVTATIPGEGPDEEGELDVRFAGPFSRQRATVRWAKPIVDGDRWIEELRLPLIQAVTGVEAVQSLRIRWSARRKVWRFELQTMSGSVISGLGAFVPVAVPFDRREADSILAMLDVFSQLGSGDSTVL